MANGEENSLNRFDGPRLVSLNSACNLLLLLHLLLLFASTSSSLSVSHLCARTSAAKKPYWLTRSSCSRSQGLLPSLPAASSSSLLLLHPPDDNTEYAKKDERNEPKRERKVPGNCFGPVILALGDPQSLRPCNRTFSAVSLAPFAAAATCARACVPLSRK